MGSCTSPPVLTLCSDTPTPLHCGCSCSPKEFEELHAIGFSYPPVKVLATVLALIRPRKISLQSESFSMSFLEPPTSFTGMTTKDVITFGECALF